MIRPFFQGYLLLIFCFSAIQLAAQTTSANMSLEECIQYAYTNHPDLKVAQLQVTDADWQIKLNKASGLPQITAGIDAMHFLKVPSIPGDALGFGPPGSRIAFQLQNSITGKAGVNQLLFSNSYLIALKAARYYKEYVISQQAVAKQKVANNVIDAYLPSLLISQNLEIFDKNITNLQKLLNDTKAINKAGFAEQLDVDRLELSISGLTTERENLARQREMVLNGLKMLIGYPIKQPLEVTDNLQALLLKYGEADLTSELNLGNRQEYNQLMKGRELSVLQSGLYKRPWLPNVVGYVQGQSSFQGNNSLFHIPSAVVGLNLSFTLWDGGLAKASKNRNIIATQTIDVQKDMLAEAFQLELANARKQYTNAAERVKSQQKNLDLAQRIFDTTTTKYKAGVGSSFEVVTAEQAVYSAQQALLQAQYDLLAGKVAIQKALGSNGK